MKKRQEKSLLYEYTESALVAVLIALLVRSFVMAAYKIPTSSMVPTLRIGDLIFSYKIPFGLRLPFTNFKIIKPTLPQRGDVIIFKSPEDSKISLIKRVVGVPGDRIEIKNRMLLINKKPSKYTPVHAQDLGVGKLHDYYQVFIEEFEGHKHHVMFRRGQDKETTKPIVIPEGKLYVLGDNRDSSEDSRYWGLISLESVEARAFMIWLSIDWDNRKLRWERVLQLIDKGL
ncbi:MAG: signal peptidase I [Oligoflexia bacterium]|nr:signal peptidase I [Oligoflexia bacterium]